MKTGSLRYLQQSVNSLKAQFYSLSGGFPKNGKQYEPLRRHQLKLPAAAHPDLSASGGLHNQSSLADYATKKTSFRHEQQRQPSIGDFARIFDLRHIFEGFGNIINRFVAYVGM